MSESISVVSSEQKAEAILERALFRISELFPVVDADMDMLSFGHDVYRVRIAEGKGRNQVTVVWGASAKKPYIGSHSEEEEVEAKSDPDLQFASSWSDALQNASSRLLKPDRIVQAVTQRWADDGSTDMVLLSPDSVARQQYIQFSPGSLFLLNLKGKLVKLPIEALYPWEYYSRQLPETLEKQSAVWLHKAEVRDIVRQLIEDVSELFPLTDEDNSLISLAKGEIGLKYAYGYWQLASAFVTEQGNVRTGLQYSTDEEDGGCIGIQHDTKSGRANLDAEQAAIKKARRMYPGEPLKTIVTVHHASANHPHSERIVLVSSCALCRKSLLKYSPNVKNLIPLNGKGCGKVPMRILYPLPDFQLPPVV